MCGEYAEVEKEGIRTLVRGIVAIQVRKIDGQDPVGSKADDKQWSDFGLYFER